jgi:hypothetical protein
LPIGCSGMGQALALQLAQRGLEAIAGADRRA